MQFLNASFQSPCLKGEVYFWPLLSMVYYNIIE